MDTCFHVAFSVIALAVVVSGQNWTVLKYYPARLCRSEPEFMQFTAVTTCYEARCSEVGDGRSSEVDCVSALPAIDLSKFVVLATYHNSNCENPFYVTAYSKACTANYGIDPFDSFTCTGPNVTVHHCNDNVCSNDCSISTLPSGCYPAGSLSFCYTGCVGVNQCFAAPINSDH